MTESFRPARIRVNPAAERHLRAGHPWVFAESIRDCRPGDPGSDLAAVYGRDNRLLALGFYDPSSPVAVRVVVRGGPADVATPEFWRPRLEGALAVRRSLALDDGTDGFRLINGESDGFPGLVLDLYGETAVMKTYCPAWERLRGSIVDQLGEVVDGCRRVIQRRSRILDPSEKAEPLLGQVPEDPVVFRENGLRFMADVVRGQKTGFFLDQRENRARVRTMAGGQDVLNVFSFSGAFSVYAAAGGARSVTDVDISAHALIEGGRNFELNRGIAGVASCRREAVKADAFSWLQKEGVRKRGRVGFGLVVVDPPSLAKSRAEQEGALRAYRHLNRSAASLVNPGGRILSASCSSHVPLERFLEAVREGVLEGGSVRKSTWEEEGVFGQPVDHPAAFAEARYLKAVVHRRVR